MKVAGFDIEHVLVGKYALQQMDEAFTLVGFEANVDHKEKILLYSG
jgi:hypothetical protein